jgi:hypothetical protein
LAFVERRRRKRGALFGGRNRGATRRATLMHDSRAETREKKLSAGCGISVAEISRLRTNNVHSSQRQHARTDQADANLARTTRGNSWRRGPSRMELKEWLMVGPWSSNGLRR